MNYSGISECDVLNGTGFRVVLFVSGCSHRCCNCQNPKTWDKNFGHPFTEKTKEYIFECLSKDYIDGITITGGDPLYESNLDTVLSLVNKIRLSFPEKTIWLYSGYTIDQIFNDDEFDIKGGIVENQTRRAIILSCDVFIDGEYINEQRDITLKWRGSSNQRVIDVKQSLEQEKVVLYCD